MKPPMACISWQNLPSRCCGCSDGITRVLLVLKVETDATKPGVVELADPRAELDDDGKRKAAGKNKEASIEVHYVAAESSGTDLQDPRCAFY